MSPGRLDADVEQYRQAVAANTPPPQLVSDPLVSGLTPIEQLLRVLGLAANLGDEQDNTDNIDEHGERDAKTSAAAEEFAAQDDGAAAELNGVAGQYPSTLPQLAAGIAGALGAAMQPITQLPQQLAQGAQQAMQAGMGLLQQAGGSAVDLGGADLGDAALADEPLDMDPADLGDPVDFAPETGGLGGPGGGPAGIGAAGPAFMPGPSAPPSAGTFASSARPGPVTQAAAPGHIAAPGGGMAGVPMVPPAALNGAVVADKDAKADTKRVSVPPVRNGAAVQGRITTPPEATTETGKAPGKPVATRRIIVTRSGDQAGQP